MTMNGMIGGAGVAGSASWFRVTDSLGTFVMDGSVGVTGADLNFAGGVAIGTGQTVSVTSWVIADNNS
jgi:hypothetical protein